jgi:NAD+ kinase
VSDRTVLLVVHAGKPGAVEAARELADRLVSSGMSVRVLDGEAERIGCATTTTVPVDPAAAAGAELVVALGGDGTLLRAAEFAHPSGAALLGINLGRVGFLAEVDRPHLESTVERIVAASYEVEDRLTLDVSIHRDGEVVARDWALNDATVEKNARHRMLELMVEVDARPLSRWTGDGLVCATPTGSTAYAFSAGGPVVWPSVQAMLIVPISAHALFARPLVVSPDSRILVEVLTDATAFCDGRRTIDVAARDCLVVRRGERPVRLARLGGSTFTDRLVSKFHLPVRGWRARGDED